MNNSLTDQFNSILSNYQNTYQKYLNSMKNINSNANLINVKNNTLIGGNIKSKTKQSNLNSCKTACISRKSCDGAIFNTSNNICSLIKDPVTIKYSKGNTAIVNPALYYSYQLQQLNKQLIDVNKQILVFVNNNQEVSENVAKQRELVMKNYSILNQERDKITQMTDDLETISSVNTDTASIVSMYYYRYLILIVIVGLLIFMLINFSSSTQRGGGKNIFKDSLYLFLVIISCLGISQNQ